LLYIIFFFGIFFAAGMYFTAADYLKLPTFSDSKAVQSVIKQDKNKVKVYDVFISELSARVSKFIKPDDYRKRKLASTLKSTEISLMPETYIATAWVKAGLMFLLIIPAIIFFPVIGIVVLFLAITTYFKEIQRADKMLKKRREDIEYELPRFAATIEQELKVSRNVLQILENYKKNAGKSFKQELDITTADMKSGSYEPALTRLEARLGSTQLSDVVRGLISVLRGDDGAMYFQMLCHDLKTLELQRLKAIALKRPGKIRKYSFFMLACFLLIYLSVMTVQILDTLKNMLF
jgi:Flp pilus assembly protein TadB